MTAVRCDAAASGDSRVQLEETPDVHDGERELERDIRPDPEQEVEAEQGHAGQQIDLAQPNSVALRVRGEDEHGAQPADELNHRGIAHRIPSTSMHRRSRVRRRCDSGLSGRLPPWFALSTGTQRPRNWKSAITPQVASTVGSHAGGADCRSW
jgi:hypothetical protein